MVCLTNLSRDQGETIMTMHRKQIAVIISAILAATVIAGCGSSEKVASSASSEQDASDEVTSEEVTEGEAADTEETVGMANPMVEYETIPEMQEVLGFDPLYLPESSGYTCSVMYIISGDLADLRFASKDGGTAEIGVRSALADTMDSDDVSGYYGDDWKESTVSDTEVETGGGSQDVDNTYFAKWSNDKYAFSVSGAVSEDEFSDILEQLVGITENEYTDDSQSSDAELPEFSYVGNDEISRICVEAAKQLYEGYDKTDVMIPAPVVGDFEETGDGATIYANVHVYGYDLEGTTLVCKNGGAYPCVIKSEGYNITDIQVANTDDEEAKLFNNDKALISKINDSDEEESIRKSWIQMYADNCDAKIDSYQDYGQNPVELVEE